MAGRLPAVHEQALNHFVTNSPWDPEPVRRRITQRMAPVIGAQAWALDDTGWLKCGTASPCVARQYTGTAGKITNCQIGVSLNLVTDTASCPVNWRLFVPQRWDPAGPDPTGDVHRRRTAARLPDNALHREKMAPRPGPDRPDHLMDRDTRTAATRRRRATATSPNSAKASKTAASPTSSQSRTPTPPTPRTPAAPHRSTGATGADHPSSTANPHPPSNTTS
jgi:hypothetical protein